MSLVRSSAVLSVFLCCIGLGFIQYSIQEDEITALNLNSRENEWCSCKGGNSSQPLPGEPGSRAMQNGLVDRPQYLVFCRKSSMAVVLPSGSLSHLKVFGLIPVQEIPKTCDYSVTSNHGRNIVHVSYTVCKVQDSICTLRIVYQNSVGQTEIATASCRVSSSQTPSLIISPTSGPQDPVLFQPAAPPPPQPVVSPPPTLGVPLTPASVIVLPSWPLQQQGCLSDGKFVFAIPANITDPPLDTSTLTVAGQAGCKPAMVNKDIAVFNFSVTECGTHSYHIGNTNIYMAEVLTPIKMLNFQYGIITRDHPVRVMIECRYSKISQDAPAYPATGWTTAEYMVMSTSLPALVRAKGLYGVQLRIAEDKTFSTFLLHDHQPLRVLLGKPVYLEVRIMSPKPEATLLVHYCIAYPRSAKSALVLLYEGCPNPLDADNISILHMADLPQNRHQRRFEVKAFQFMDQSTNKYLKEEIYFMCSTEVCMPSQTPCKETCFDVKS